MKTFFARHSWKVELASIGTTLPSLALYLYLNWQNWFAYRVTTHDLTIFAQEVKSWATLGYPVSTFRGGEGFNRLGDHFSPINALLAPFWHLWPSAAMLIVAQTVLVTISVWIVARVAIVRLGRTPGVLVGLSYGLSYAVIGTITASFHEVAWAMPLLALAGVAYLEKKPWTTLLWLAPLVFVKEDMGASIAVAAVVLAWQHKRWIYLIGAIWGVGWSALSIFVLIPFFNIASQYDQLIIFANEVPLLNPAKIPMVAMFILAGMFLPLLSPWALVALPSIGWRLISTLSGTVSVDYWYGATTIIIVFIAVIDGYPKVVEWARSGSKLRAQVPKIIIWTMLPMNLAMTANLAWLPTWLLPRDFDTQFITDLIEDVPEDAIVAAIGPFSDHLMAKHDVYCSDRCYQVGGYTPMIPTPDWVSFRNVTYTFTDWYEAGGFAEKNIHYEVWEYEDLNFWVAKRIDAATY